MEDSFAKTDHRPQTHISLCVFYVILTGGDLSNELVRHFLIECTQKGVRLKGCPNEPYFGEYLLCLNLSPHSWLTRVTLAGRLATLHQSDRLHAPYCSLLVCGTLYQWLVMGNLVCRQMTG